MSIKRLETSQRMSRAVIHNGTVYFCGQVAKNYDADVTGQTRTTLEKLDALLESVGSDKTKLLSATIYLKNIADFQAMNAVWDEWIPEGYAPARACVEANMASPALLVEISLTAAVE